MTTVRYFIPDDGDTEEAPNVFLAPKSSSITKLGTIKSSFPLPGKYHFRFKTSLDPNSSLAVWMDCVDDSKAVPMYQTSIIAKVTRIGLEDDEFEEYETDDSDKEFEELRGAAASAAATASTHYRNPSNSSSNAVSSRSSPTPQSEDLFNVFDNTSTYSNPPSSHASSTDLFEDNTSSLDDFLSGGSTAASTADHSNDLLGMGATTSMPQTAMPQQSHLSASMPVNMPSHQPQQQYPYNQNAQQQQQQYSYNAQNNGPFGNLNWQ